MDYGKYLYQQNKKEHESEEASEEHHGREVKFRPNTDEHDYDIQKESHHPFPDAGGDKVKAAVFFPGREIVHQSIGQRDHRSVD